ncbi:hypothetical protein [Altererythrobacter sp. ZODW24]|uniref:hypothetical protein n=1 Tax=Altererythrobacter sp. ZODW24 TaxID=2185142 RepID=UPI000DF73A24|nr:hypothetical protein [Altererythrobacter sp. ZODW24]
MILELLLLTASPQELHPRENPQMAVEWLDHYGYCLHVNFEKVISQEPDGEGIEAARRALIRCAPVHASAMQKVVDELVKNGRRTGPQRRDAAERLLKTIEEAFASSADVSIADLEPAYALRATL